MLKKIPSFFPELGKTEKSSQSNIKKIQNLFVKWEKFEVEPKTNNQKPKFWIYRWIGKS